MTASTFQIHESGRYSLRPSYIVLVADLGRIHGEEATLIGVCRDWDSETGIISHGIASSSDVTRLELSLGQKLNAALESGTAIQSWVTADAPSRVVDLRPLEVRASSPVRPGTMTSTQLPKLSTNATRYADFDAAVAEAGVLVERVEKQRTAALALRKTWDIGQMKHRADWPQWLPHWVRDEVRQNSRTWLELSNAPLPTPEAPPVIQSVIVEPTPAPAAKGFVSRFMEVLS